MPTEEIDFESPAFIEAVTAAKAAPAVEVQEINYDKPIITSDETDDTLAPVTTTTVVAPTDTKPVITEPNYAEYLTNKSGGLFKTEEDFVAALEKFKNYDTFESKVKDLETKIPIFKSDEAKQWFDLVQSDEGTKVLKDYIAEKEKDYTTMSDIDVRREGLQKEHPNWTKKDVELELRHKYGKNLELKDLTAIDKEEEPDEYLDAVNHNKEVEKNLELLAVHARDDRYSLIEKQKAISLPEIKKTDTPVTTPQLSEADKADAVAKWQKNVEENLPKLSNISVNIDDKGVEYVSTDEDKAALQAELKDFNIFKWFGDRGWSNADNSWNVLKIAEDVRWLKEKENVVKSVAAQVKTEAIRATMAKIKGIDPNYQEPGPPKVYNTLAEAAHAAIKKKESAQRGEEWEETD